MFLPQPRVKTCSNSIAEMKEFSLRGSRRLVERNLRIGEIVHGHLVPWADRPPLFPPVKLGRVSSSFVAVCEGESRDQRDDARRAERVKKLNIALLASSLLPRVGGAEVVVHNLAEGLRREKHRVDVITWWGQCRVMRHLVAYPVRPFLPRSFTWSGVGTWKRRGVAGLTMGLQVAFYQARFRYDLWHIHLAFPGAALAAGTLARMGVPFLVRAATH